MLDVKLLYGRSTGRCCFPACPNSCIMEDLATGKLFNSGQIAHIEGVAKNSARHNASLTKKQRDSYRNWILMCGEHHPRIDAEGESVDRAYTVQTILQWKREAEARILRQTQKIMPEISSLELAVVTKHLQKEVSSTNITFDFLNIKDKIIKNNLSSYVETLLETGIAKAPEVAHFVNGMEGISPGFSESLRAGFAQKYRELWQAAYREDSLFEMLCEYASHNSANVREKAAGLAVVAYFFELCEVFEK